MKISLHISFCLIFLITSAVTAQISQPFSNVNSGKVERSSGTYTMIGTLGQPIIGSLAQGDYSISAGFSNNKLTLTRNLPDLYIEYADIFDLPSDGLFPGDSVRLDYTIRNLGIVPIDGGYSVSVYNISGEQVDIQNDLSIWNRYIGDYIGPDETFQEDLYIQIPALNLDALAGQWVLVVDPENSIEEASERNIRPIPLQELRPDEEIPTYSGVTYPEIIEDGADVGILDLADNGVIQSIQFYHRPITSGDFTVHFVTSDNYITLQDDWLDQTGVEYYFDVSDYGGNHLITPRYQTFRRFTPSLPKMKTGSDVSSYQILSLPGRLENQPGLIDVFSGWGQPEPKSWRMYDWDPINQGYNELATFNSIEPMTGYMAIFSDNQGGSSITTPEDHPVGGSRDSDYPEIQLRMGWNLIGNPFVINIPVNQIYDVSQFTGSVRMRGFNGQFFDASILEAYSGLFVYTDGQNDILRFPRRNASGGRTRVPGPLRNPIGAEHWEVTFELENGNFKDHLAGFGMHPEASEGVDQFDDPAMPRFAEFLDVNFHHPEHFYPRFSKEVVNTQAGYVFSFSVESNIEGLSTLRWDNSFFGPNDLNLVLFDKQKQRRFDMRRGDSYTAKMIGRYEFEVYFGTSDFIEKSLEPDFVLLGQNYPNPFVNETIIPVTLPPWSLNYDLKITVFDQAGRIIKEIVKEEEEPGFHEYIWKVNQEGLNSVIREGMYFYQLDVLNKADVATQYRRMILSK